MPADLQDAPPRRSADTIFRLAVASCASVVLLLLGGMLVRTTWSAWPVFQHSGIGFLTGTTWNPNTGTFGALPYIYGTLVTSVVALILAVPVAVLIALYLSEIAPPAIGTYLGYVVDLLAAVPSVVYGLWGVFVLVPFLTTYLWQPLSNHLAFIPIFAHFASGRNFLTALAVGATRWEMIRLAVLPPSRSGIVAAIMLGFGRAVGETIAVAYLIGGFPHITAHLLQQGSTIAANIALQFNEAASQPLFKAALIGLGVVLFAITLIINVAARLIIRRGNSR